MNMKLISLTAVAMGALMSGVVNAAPQAFTNTQTIMPANGTYNCATLTNNIKVNMSKDVVAGFDCDAGGTAFIAGACHPAGTNKQQTLQCTWTEVTPATADAPAVYQTQAGCAATPTTTVTYGTPFTGRLYFYGSSGGGSVTSDNLGATSCATTTITAKTKLP